MYLRYQRNVILTSKQIHSHHVIEFVEVDLPFYITCFCANAFFIPFCASTFLKIAFPTAFLNIAFRTAFLNTAFFIPFRAAAFLNPFPAKPFLNIAFLTAFFPNAFVLLFLILLFLFPSVLVRSLPLDSVPYHILLICFYISIVAQLVLPNTFSYPILVILCELEKLQRVSC